MQHYSRKAWINRQQPTLGTALQSSQPMGKKHAHLISRGPDRFPGCYLGDRVRPDGSQPGNLA